MNSDHEELFRPVRAALKEAGAPLLAAPEDLAGRVLEGAAAPGRRLWPALTGLSLAVGLAALLLFMPPSGGRSPAPAGPSLTERFDNPFGARVPGEASGSDFLCRLSARAVSGPGAGPVLVNLKEGL